MTLREGVAETAVATGQAPAELRSYQQDNAGRQRTREAGAPETALHSLHRVATRVHFRRGVTIFNDGDPSTHFYKLDGGAVRLCKHAVDGRRQIIDFVMPGEYLGLVQLSEHFCTAEAIGDVEALSYPQESLRRLVDADASASSYIRNLLSQNFISLNRHLMILGRLAAKERVASFLLMLAERQRQARVGYVELLMSRREIADYLGLTVETICRVLAVLKGVGAIELASVHSIWLRDPALLRAIADGTGLEAGIGVGNAA